MGEFDVLAVAVAVAGLGIGVAHVYRNWQLSKLQKVQEANNKILIEILTEIKGVREDLPKPSGVEITPELREAARAGAFFSVALLEEMEERKGGKEPDGKAP